LNIYSVNFLNRTKNLANYTSENKRYIEFPLSIPEIIFCYLNGIKLNILSANKGIKSNKLLKKLFQKKINYLYKYFKNIFSILKKNDNLRKKLVVTFIKYTFCLILRNLIFFIIIFILIHDNFY